MAEARLAVRSCGPLVSYQDGGRLGMLRFGVPASGPMDRLAHAAAHAALGRPVGGTAIEISLGGLELVCESGDVTCSITGGAFQVGHAGATTTSWCVRTLREGEVLAVRPGRQGSWAYLAFAGELACATWAGHTATHVPSGFGGGCLERGASIVVHQAQVAEDREGPLPQPPGSWPRAVGRVVLGPQTQQFEPDAVDALLREPFTLTAASDRMGVRLAGPALRLKNALSIPSEPITRGSIQVNGDGVASILMADHQTTGGYPKIATLLSSDLDALAQLRPGDRLAFSAVEADEAVALVRAEARARQQFLGLAGQLRGSLQDRLMRENLVSGLVWAQAADGATSP